MPSSVPTTPKSIEDYRPHVGDAVIDEIIALAEPLKNARVLHVNATAFGGGVAEILNSAIPLLQNLGIDADWQVMDGTAEFFNVTKGMHNAMQGMHIPWNNAMAGIWREVNQANADALAQDLLVRLAGNRAGAAGEWETDQKIVAMYSSDIDVDIPH